MQEHRYSFIIDATPEEIWSAMHPRLPDNLPGAGVMGEFGPMTRKIEHGTVTIEILHEGDEHCDAGLVRHCFFRVPKYLHQRWGRPVVGAHHRCRSLRVRQVLRDRQAVVVARGG